MDNEPQPNDPNQPPTPAPMPVPLPKLNLTDEEKAALKTAFGRKLTRKKVVARLRAKYGVEEDELKVMYRKDEDLFRFYLNEARTLGEVKFADAEDKTAPKAKVSFTAEQKQALTEIKLQKDRAERIALAKKAKAVKPPIPEAADADRKAFEEAGKHLPKGAQVSYDEMLKGIRQGLNLTEADLEEGA